MFAGAFNTIAQALDVYKKAVEVRDRNVANSQDENYVRESPLIQSDLYTGITLQEVRRIQNFNFINLRNEKLSLVSSLEERKEVLSQIESLFQAGKGLEDYVNDFFKAYEDFLKEPTNEGAKSELLSSANALVNAVKSRYKQLTNLSQSLDNVLQKYVRRVNELLKKLYNVNMEITLAYAQSGGKDYRTLLNQRDAYLKELSQYLYVRAQEDELGRVKVITDKGFVLVDFGNAYYTLGVENGRVKYKRDQSDITELLSGGKIKGLIDSRNDINTTLNNLESLVNTLSGLKIPLNGGTEKNVFSVNSSLDIDTFSVNITRNDLDNVDFARATDYAENGLNVWENAKKDVIRLTDYIGSEKKSLESEYDTEKALYDSLERKILERQGVSVDEEFMEIIKLQRTYEAVAKILPRIDELMQTTINMI
ncbi:flagellar hook-associated protein FlgK [Aquifex pyrophilus]